jgi:DeoR family transcriptional regulator of aga operon
VDGAHERRERIADQLAGDGAATVAELSRRFGVSEVTIRADLRALESARLVRRTRGGAVAVAAADPRPPRPAAAEPDGLSPPATAAAALVRAGDTVVVESSVAVADALRGRTHSGVTVCTASLDVATALRGTDITVVLAGGTLDAASGLVGPPQAGPMWEQVTADLAILGCDGVSASGGVTADDPARAWVWRRCAAMARRRVLLAGPSTVGRVAECVLSDLGRIDLCLVSSTVDHQALAALRRAGLMVRTH